MSSFQICLCGSAPGYPHHPCCPEPCYRESGADWQLQWAENLRAALEGTGKALAAVNKTNLGLVEELTRENARLLKQLQELQIQVAALKVAGMANNKDQGVLL